MAHWTDNHTKKDIVDFYEDHITNLRAELQEERELADRLVEAAAMVMCDVEDVTPDSVWERIPIHTWNSLTYVIGYIRARRAK